MICKNETGNTEFLSADMNLIFRARMLWMTLSMWLRAFLVSTYTGLPYQESVMKKLYSMPVDVGNTLRIFFGDKITDDYVNLLSQYILLYQYIFVSQKNGDIAAVEQYTKQLYENIRVRSEYFARINPFWKANDWEMLMRNFADLTLEESTTFLTGEYDRNIQIFDRILTQSTLMGDYFSEGLIDYLNYSNRSPRNNRP